MVFIDFAEVPALNVLSAFTMAQDDFALKIHFSQITCLCFPPKKPPKFIPEK